MKATMAFFDRELFVGIRGGADHGGTANEDLSDQLAAAMADFGLGEDSDGDDDEGTAGVDTPLHLPPAERGTAIPLIPETAPPAAHGQRGQRNATPGPSRPQVAAIRTATTEPHDLEQNDESQPAPVASKRRATRAQARGKGKGKTSG